MPSRRYIPDRRRTSLLEEQEARHQERLSALRGQRDLMLYALLDLEERVRRLEGPRDEGRVPALALVKKARDEEFETGDIHAVNKLG